MRWFRGFCVNVKSYGQREVSGSKKTHREPFALQNAKCATNLRYTLKLGKRSKDIHHQLT